jgi:hypothetical protein
MWQALPAFLLCVCFAGTSSCVCRCVPVSPFCFLVLCLLCCAFLQECLCRCLLVAYYCCRVGFPRHAVHLHLVGRAVCGACPVCGLCCVHSVACGALTGPLVTLGLCQQAVCLHV